MSRTAQNDYRSKYGWYLDDLPDPSGCEPDSVMRYLWERGDTGAEVGMLADIVCLTDLLRDMTPGMVARARDDGRSWQDVGDALGMTRQAAQQRFGETADS